MDQYSLTQAYTLLALDDRGKLSGLQTQRVIGLVAAGLLELEGGGIIALSSEGATILKTLPGRLVYLSPLYDELPPEGSIAMDRVVQPFIRALSTKKITAYVDALGTSLAALEAVTIVQTGVFDKKNLYLPKPAAVKNLTADIQAIGTSSTSPKRDEVALTMLLDRTQLLRDYFSYAEQQAIKGAMAALKTQGDPEIDAFLAAYEAFFTAITAIIVATC